MVSQLQALLFDLGNVIIHFDDEKKCRNLAGVTGLSEEEIRQLLVEDRFQARFETGGISADEFLKPFAEASAQDFHDEDFWRAFCDIFQLNEELVEHLPRFRAAGLRLVVVSNTNEAHMRWEREHHDFFQYFDATVLSHEVRALKPDPAFYLAASNAAACSLAEALFIDDFVGNVDGAAKFGFQTHHFTKTGRFLDEMAARGY